MGKYCGRGNKQLGAKALAVYNVAEGEAGGRKFLHTKHAVGPQRRDAKITENSFKLTGLDISFEMPRI